MPELPTGTVTFLFTDVEGSTRGWERAPVAMRAAIARHDALLRQAIAAHAGRVVKGTGDGVHAAFARVSAALAASLAAQRALLAEDWGEAGPLGVRMALHSGEAEEREGDYFGPALNRAARLLAAGHGGQVLLSQATSDLARDALPAEVSLRDLGEHRLKDLRQAERVFQLLHPDLPEAFPPLKSLDIRPNNLPLQLTSFVGREKDLAEVQRLFGTTRLLTLTGSGGSGKTRLALEVARRVLDAFPDGVWVVELAPVSDPALVAGAVAEALGVRDGLRRAMDDVHVFALRNRHLLLVLDNCEHLVPECARIAHRLLRGCADLTILVTSREALKIDGELIWRIPSLSLPPPLAVPNAETPGGRGAGNQIAASLRLPAPSSAVVEEVGKAEAVRLFVERARAVRPGFRLNDRNTAAVAQICVRLDGIPLAIELAAARTGLLSVEQIAEGLDRRFGLLTGGSRTALARHQTLAAMVGWSYDLLCEAERVLFNRLAVFAGGFTLGAADQICRDKTCALPFLPSSSTCALPSDLLDLLDALVNKSLISVTADDDGPVRYGLLETLRAYARERLEASGEAARIGEHHAAYYLALVEECVRKQTSAGPESRNWDAGLEVEQANLRLALAWHREHDPSAGLRLAAGLSWYWVFHNDLIEGDGWLSTFLALTPGEPSTRGRALLGLATLKRDQGELDVAQRLYEESLATCRQVDDRWGVARSVAMLAQQARSRGHYEQAISLTEESLPIARELRSEDSIMWGLFNLAQIHLHQENFGLARIFANEALKISPRNFRVLEQVVQIAEGDDDCARIEATLREVLAKARHQRMLSDAGRTLNLLGRVACKRGHRTRARRLAETSLRIARATGLNDLIYSCLHDLGNLAWNGGDPSQAHAHLAEWLNRAMRVGNRQFIAFGLLVGAHRALDSGDYSRTVRLFGAADRTMPDYRFATQLFDPVGHARNVAKARAVLDPDAFARAWAEGQAMTLEQAIADALVDGDA
jgi:predicted ATPase/class 3 adenylate cyclase